MLSDLLDLRLFVAVVDEGSITAGAARVPLSLPSASARIRELERRAGTALLVRGRRGVRPTAAGLIFARHARDVVEDLRLLDDAVAAATRPAGHRLVLLAGASAMARLVPRAMISFLRECPDVDVVAEERSSTESARMLTEGGADVAVVIAGLVGTADGDDLLGDDSLVAVGAPDGVLARVRRPLAFAEIAEHPMVGLTEDSSLHRTLVTRLGDRAPLPRFRARAVDLGTVTALVAAGVGLAVVPRHVVDPALGLVVRELSDPWAHRVLTVRTATNAGAGAGGLVAHLRAAAAVDRPS
ncbi:LysR family transcriptional regulator [Pseudonocardia nematodicida]|uniref:LysR family transcriptional regulator n=1 Tax=Pseudonocardia nematodicida TaxID=1206997 RepID=A0ABV1KFM2_9PSEU